MSLSGTRIVPAEPIGDFTDFGITAFTTTRAAGSFSVASREPVSEVMARWTALRGSFQEVSRLATASQVHGDRILEHTSGWEGWLRGDSADGHIARTTGIAMAVSVADCVPVFIAHPSGTAALLHAGWRGTAAGILDRALDRLTRVGLSPSELRLHLGPAICGDCYEVSPDVYQRLTGRRVGAPSTVDIRALLADRARSRGVAHVSVSQWCTRCNNDRFFSHRAGDEGRQLGVLVVPRRLVPGVLDSP
ncbi:MAG TPA: polyphenol oxidase family protein [Gemmatimonadaceae bacterium]|nr:polyphenol oxidase family protein [Gemmatimonadaceae bacterium]